MSVITFTSSMPQLNDVITKHTIPDENGFYKQLLGGFNVYNSSGDFYPYTNAILALFDASASLMRRLNNGVLKSEVNHPKRKPGETDEEFAEKWLSINPDNVCGIFNKIELAKEPVSVPGQNQPVYLTWGYVKPTGVKKDVLESSLRDPDVNTAFSIRPVSRLVNNGGVTIRNVIHIVTWDYVEEPGINFATKAATSAIRESIGENFEIPITEGTVRYLKAHVESSISEFTGETKDNILEAIDAIEHCLGGRCIYTGW